MRDLNVSPDPATVKLLIRAARDCHLGDLSSLTSDIYALNQGHKRMLQNQTKNEHLASKGKDIVFEDLQWKSIQNSGKIPKQMVADPNGVHITSITNKKYEWWEEDSRIPSELKAISYLTSKSDPAVSSAITQTSQTLLPANSVYNDLFPSDPLTFETLEAAVTPAH